MAANQTIYGKRPVEEAERGRRRVHRVWRAPETSAEELERLCGSPDHQGVVAEVDPYPYADRNALLRVEGGLIVALDQVQDPRNLGAVCRSAELAGAAGVVIPERRAAEVTAATCKASAGAVEHLSIARVRNLADWLEEAKDGGVLDLGRRRRRRLSSLGCRPQRLDGPRPGWGGERDPPPGGVRLRRPRRPAAARKDRFPQRLRGRRRRCSSRPSASAAEPFCREPRRGSNCNGGCTNVCSGLTE